MQRKAAILTAAVLALTTSSAWASDRGSMEDQLACTPDVYRLCSRFIPDEGQIVACLQRNIASLSPDCHRVFSEPAHAPQGNGVDDPD